VVLVVRVEEEKMDKPVDEVVMVEMPQDIVTEKMEKPVVPVESELSPILKACNSECKLIGTYSGGYGSNGAPGAAAGNVFVTVHDDDTDLLLPIDYDVNGGPGGQSGQHGEPGDGGMGGRGGNPHAWTESRGNTVYAKTRPGGSNGSNGSPGMRANTYLESGQA
jgi:hypothetical protein